MLGALEGATPSGLSDALRALLVIYDLHTAPIGAVGSSARWQHHPAVAGLKAHLESVFESALRDMDAERRWQLPDDPAAALRAIAATDRVPSIYHWVAEEADRAQVVGFLAREGGPDAGFDDLVALAQIGLDGAPKHEMARNYWDEMGAGEPADVHTTLHQRLVDVLEVPRIPRGGLSTGALLRSALTSYLAVNRVRQAELIGALGLIEIQAGPRCRKVLEGLRRVGAPTEALRFYKVHADVDPRHGRDWLEHVVTPLSEDPATGLAVVQGARWRSVVNRRFFQEVARELRFSSQHRGDIRVPTA